MRPRDVRDADAEELLRAEAEDEFLLLDAPPAGRNIDLRERREDVELQSALTFGLALGARADAAAAREAAAAGPLERMLNLTAASFVASASFAGGASGGQMHVGDATGLPGLIATLGTLGVFGAAPGGAGMLASPAAVVFAVELDERLVAVLGADEEDARDAAALRRLCAAV